jgi:5-methylcytosine-specific restriction endonuclease McrA
MPKCIVKECKNFTRYKNTKIKYCSMHLARIKRNGNTELKSGSHALEKIPHERVDDFILKNCHEMIDIEMAKKIREMGFLGATQWTIKYRRRKLGIKKYLYGEIKKHKAWIRSQAIKKYGNECELCGYRLSIDTHHIKPKNEGGLHEIDNLMILCPNCHSLITRKIFYINSRKDIPMIQRKIKELTNKT